MMVQNPLGDSGSSRRRSQKRIIIYISTLRCCSSRRVVLARRSLCVLQRIARGQMPLYRKPLTERKPVPIPIPLTVKVLVVLMDDSAAPGLNEAVGHYHWPVLRQPSAGKALKNIRLIRPQVLIVQVDGSVMILQEATRLIRFLRTYPPRPGVVAIASNHSDETERAMRAAGVSCYLPEDADADLIEQSVSQLLANFAAQAASPSKVQRQLDRRVPSGEGARTSTGRPIIVPAARQQEEA